MLDTALGFSLLVSTIITAIVYVVTRSKNKSEEEQKDKLNDTIILFVIRNVAGNGAGYSHARAGARQKPKGGAKVKWFDVFIKRIRQNLLFFILLNQACFAACPHK